MYFRKLLAQRRIVTAPPAGYTAYATRFAGDGQCWLERDGTGTGMTDSATFTISFWINPFGSNTDDWRIFGTNNRISVSRGGGDERIGISLINTNGTAEVDLRQNTAIVPALGSSTGWSWVGICVDNNTAGACFIYIANAGTSWVATDCSNRVNDTGGGAVFDFTDFEWTMAAVNGGGGIHMAAEISEFYMSQTYFDLSNSSNRDLFYNSTTHKPAGDLTSVGSPIWYFNQPYTSFTTNAGSAGNMVKKGTTPLAEGTPP